MPATGGASAPTPPPGSTAPADSAAGEAERLTRLAARVLGVPAALVTRLADGRETVVAGTGLRGALAPGREVRLARYFRRRSAAPALVVRDARQGAGGAAGLADLEVAACVVCPLRDAAGRVLGTLAALDFLPRRWSRDAAAILRDIAVFAGREAELAEARDAERRVAAALAEAEAALTGTAHLRGLVEQPLVGLFTMEGGRIAWANRAFARILGYTTEEITGMESPENLLLDGEDRERLLRQVSEPIDGQESVHVCTSARRRDASPARVELRMCGLRVGERFIVVGAAQDLAGTAADDDVRAEAGRYRRAFDDALSGAVIASADCRILACNREFARIAGFASPAAAVGTELARLEREPGQWTALLEQLRSKGEIPPRELELARRDGAPVRVVAQMAADFGPGGEMREVRAYLVDVTQRALREESLRQSHELLRLLELATNDVTWDWDLVTGRMTWNGAGARRFRYAAAEVRPSLEWHFERMHPDDRERVVAGLQQAISGLGEAWTDEYRFLRGDGTYATVHDRAYVVRNERGEPVRVTGWMVDVTERKRNEENQRFLARASAVLDAALDADLIAASLARLCIPTLADFCVLDLVEEDGAVRRAAVAHARSSRERLLSPGAAVPAGTSPEGHPVLAVVEGGEPVLCAECDEASLDELDRVLGERNARRLGAHSYMVVPVKAHAQVLAALTVCLSQPGRRYGPMDLMVAKDLAYRAGLAFENARLYQTAQRALRAREEVLGVVSHDLRGPLSTIVVTAVLLSETGRDRRDETRKWLDVIRRSADQMNTLIGDLLDMGSMEAGRFAVEPVAGDLRVLLEESCEQLRPLCDTRGLRLELDAPPSLPFVALDARQIARVLSNLAGNAIKFTPDGGVVRVRASAAGAEVRVEIADTGPGIPAEQLPKVFDRFWKGRRGDGQGAGLGLTIARGIVEAHRGRIGVESTPGHGSTFWFTLPAAEPAAGIQAGEPIGAAGEGSDGR